jgi:hypothetical protein
MHEQFCSSERFFLDKLTRVDDEEEGRNAEIFIYCSGRRTAAA